MLPIADLENHIESIILNQTESIEAWFTKCWQATPPAITSSVDLRHSGFKIAPVDTNLFPAGFNNIHPDFFPWCIQAAQLIFKERAPNCTKILLLPENHTRNLFYLNSLHVLQDIISKAGFNVRIGSLDPSITMPIEMLTEKGDRLVIEPLVRHNNHVRLHDFEPCLLFLNNDLSSGVPEILHGLEQSIQSPVELGWATRLKSSHFKYFSEVAKEFAAFIDLDPWLIDPMFTAIDGVDFMAQTGINELVTAVDGLLAQIQRKYIQHGITKKPFVVVKADNGTYGMSVIMVQKGSQLRELNRKQRTRMSATKGSQTVTRLIIQEGVYSFETMLDGAVAEPVVYMIGQSVVGGFYRVHNDRGSDENLNGPGMHFEPWEFINKPKRFYVYSVIARLAALAAARELAAVRSAS